MPGEVNIDGRKKEPGQRQQAKAQGSLTILRKIVFFIIILIQLLDEDFKVIHFYICVCCPLVSHHNGTMPTKA
jgi:hypothetical protein